MVPVEERPLSMSPGRSTSRRGEGVSSTTLCTLPLVRVGRRISTFRHGTEEVTVQNLDLRIPFALFFLACFISSLDPGQTRVPLYSRGKG